MDLRELRIGNLAQNKDGNVFEVDNVSESGVNGMSWTDSHYGNISGGFDYMYTSEEVFGVPLTEEWLVKFGFEMTSDGFFDRGINGFNVTIDYEIRFNGKIICNAPKSVHQLQNLYFALTGEELTIKQ